MGEMLQDKGNPWRGMLYGMTSRLPWAGDPRPLWKAWDDFGMQGTQMIGYWVADNPVKTSNPDVPATIYKKPGAVMVSVASWAKTDTTIKLEIDWKALGIDPDKAVIMAPAIRNFQPAATFGKNKGIPCGEKQRLAADHSVIRLLHMTACVKIRVRRKYLPALSRYKGDY